MANPSPIHVLGRAALDRVEGLGRMGIYFSRIARATGSLPWQFAVIVQQLYFVGSRSLFVIAVAGAFVGMVVALQFYDTLVRFGSVALLGSAVGLSLILSLIHI